MAYMKRKKVNNNDANVKDSVTQHVRKGDVVAEGGSGRIPAGVRIGTLRIYIHKADITKLKVDSIVNAANGHLHHGGGVARAIADAAGKQLTTHSKQVVKEHKKKEFAPTDVIATTSGDLPCGMVLHAVGPKWPESMAFHKEMKEKQCEKELHEVFSNVLKYANLQKIESIAIPPISSGIFGVPANMVSSAMTHALMSYTLNSSENNTVTEVHCVDINPIILSDVVNKLLLQDQKSMPLSEKEIQEKLTEVMMTEETKVGTKPEHTREAKSDEKMIPVESELLAANTENLIGKSISDHIAEKSEEHSKEKNTTGTKSKAKTKTRDKQVVDTNAKVKTKLKPSKKNKDQGRDAMVTNTLPAKETCPENTESISNERRSHKSSQTEVTSNKTKTDKPLPGKETKTVHEQKYPAATPEKGKSYTSDAEDGGTFETSTQLEQNGAKVVLTSFKRTSTTSSVTTESTHTDHQAAAGFIKIEIQCPQSYLSITENVVELTHL